MPTSRLSRLTIISLSLFAATQISAQTVDDEIKRVTRTLTPNIVIKGTPEKYHSLADSMAKYKVPGVSIAVIQDGKLAWAQGFGVKIAGSKDAVKDAVTTDTLFQAASISKPVAATAMLRLVEQGKFTLDTPINTYLKTW